MDNESQVFQRLSHFCNPVCSTFANGIGSHTELTLRLYPSVRRSQGNHQKRLIR